jgi:hypothetical protein
MEITLQQVEKYTKFFRVLKVLIDEGLPYKVTDLVKKHYVSGSIMKFAIDKKIVRRVGSGKYKFLVSKIEPKHARDVLVAIQEDVRGRRKDGKFKKPLRYGGFEVQSQMLLESLPKEFTTKTACMAAIDKLGIAYDSVSSVLTSLVRQGHVKRVRRGRYKKTNVLEKNKKETVVENVSVVEKEKKPRCDMPRVYVSTREYFFFGICVFKAARKVSIVS